MARARVAGVEVTLAVPAALLMVILYRLPLLAAESGRCGVARRSRAGNRTGVLKPLVSEGTRAARGHCEGGREQHVILAAVSAKAEPKRQPISSPTKVGWMPGSRPFTRSQVQIWKWWSQQTSLKANMDRPTSLRTLSGRSSETTNWVTRVP